MKPLFCTWNIFPKQIILNGEAEFIPCFVYQPVLTLSLQLSYVSLIVYCRRMKNVTPFPAINVHDLIPRIHTLPYIAKDVVILRTLR